MPDVTIKQYAGTIDIPVDRLLEQLTDAGISDKSPEDLISDAEKAELLGFLRRKHGKDEKSEPRKITLRRKSVSEIKVPVASQTRSKLRSKTINVEYRKKRTYVKRSVIDDEAAEKAAEAAKAEEEIQAAAEQARLSEAAGVESAASSSAEVMGDARAEDQASAPTTEEMDIGVESPETDILQKLAPDVATPTSRKEEGSAKVLPAPEDGNRSSRAR